MWPESPRGNTAGNVVWWVATSVAIIEVQPDETGWLVQKEKKVSTFA